MSACEGTSASQRSAIDPEPPAEGAQFGEIAVDEIVVFERPPHLDAGVAAAQADLHRFGGEDDVEAAAAELRYHPEEDGAHTFDSPPFPQEAKEARKPHAPVEFLEDGVDVGNRQA